MEEIELTVVLPTFRECENLAIFIPQIEKEFSDVLLEIIVVDDNSQDGTDKLIETLNLRYQNIRLIVRPSLFGIGSAIRRGYDDARGEYILSSDADLSFSVADMRVLLNTIQQGFGLVTGYRHNGGNYERKTLAVKVKYFVSRWGNKIVQKISGLKTRDFSANFRVIRRDAWKKIETQEKTNALLFEMIVKAYRQGIKITEVPVAFSERKFGNSKLNIWKEAPKFLIKFIKYSFLDN
ncbi:MAG: glycosyltransferase [Candidatus Magasanikbacteria bacterium]|nr:glycosyltransferase [Candidatus Magasanikbacteria bacterium]